MKGKVVKQMRIHKRKMSIAQCILNMSILLLLFILLYPLSMAVWSSMKSDLDYTSSMWFPTMPLRMSNFAVAFEAVYRYVLNTVFVCAVGVSGSLLVSSLAAYAFTKMTFPGRKILYAAVIGLMMMPGVLTLVPSYVLYKNLNLLDSYWVLIIPVVVQQSIYGVFLLTTAFRGLPKEIFEAAKIDGAGNFGCYWRIAVPLSLPIMCTLGIMEIVNVWNDYIWPQITIRDIDKLPISAGLLVNFEGAYSSNMPVTFAGYLLSSLPLILLFIFANKYYVQGLVGSGIKM